MKYSMFMDQNIQHCQEFNSSQYDYRFNVTQLKLHNPFYRYKRTNSKLSMARQKTQNCQHNVEDQSWRVRINMYTYYNATVIEKVWYFQKSRWVKQNLET